MCLDCYYRDLATLFETHFLNTLTCLILSASFMWAENQGIVNMSSNYIWREVPTKRLKQTASVCMQLLPVSALPAQVTHCPPVWLQCLFFLFDLYSTLSFVFSCVWVCVCVCVCVCARVVLRCVRARYFRCVPTHIRGCRCNFVLLKESVSVFRHNRPVFHCNWVFANVCDRLSEKFQRCLRLGKQEEAQCAHWLGPLIVINPTLGSLPSRKPTHNWFTH